MKYIYAFIFSLFVCATAVAQNQNVIAGTNGVVVRPTNFWTADASNARTGIGLGLASLTNTNVTNFRTSLGLSDYLTNSVIPLTNGGTGANSAIIARSNIGLSWAALTNTNYENFRTLLYGGTTNAILVNSNNIVVYPTNFWQNAPITTVVQYFTSITTNSTSLATNSRNLFVHSMSTNVSGVTNTIILPVDANTFAGDIATIIHRGSTSTVTLVKVGSVSSNTLIALSNYNETVDFMREQNEWTFAENPSFVEPIFFSGTNALVNAAQSRTNLGLGWSALTNSNSANALLGVTTNNNTLVGFTNLRITNPIIFNSDLTSQAGGSISVSTFTASTSYSLNNATNTNALSLDYDGTNYFSKFSFNTTSLLSLKPSTILASVPIGFNNTTNESITRTNIGLGWSALTNTNTTNFQSAVFNTNSTPSGSAFNTIVAWMEVNVITNGSNSSFRIPLFK